MDSRICQPLSASPAKPGGLPEALESRRQSEARFICWGRGRRGASERANHAAGRQAVRMALRLMPLSDIVNEAENLLKTKDRRSNFLSREADNILKKATYCKRWGASVRQRERQIVVSSRRKRPRMVSDLG